LLSTREGLAFPRLRCYTGDKVNSFFPGPQSHCRGFAGFFAHIRLPFLRLTSAPQKPPRIARPYRYRPFRTGSLALAGVMAETVCKAFVSLPGYAIQFSEASFLNHI
jgi:hypothetical protein